MLFRQGDVRRVQGAIGVWRCHHPDLCTVNLHRAVQGLLSSLGVLFLFKQLLVGPRGLWGNTTPPCPALSSKTALAAKFPFFSIPYNFWFNSCAFLCCTKNCGNIIPCAA